MNSMGARFGYAAGTGIVSVGQLKAEALWAEAAGFESFWVSQVFGVDPIVALAAVGSAVPGFRELGTSVVPLAGRHPLALGAQARTAQSALDGRFTLGIGPSHQMVIEGFYGESYKRIFGRTEEFLSALGPLSNGEPCGFEGEQIFAKGWLTTEAAPVPMLLAALGPKMLELAGRATAGDVGKFMWSQNHCRPHCTATQRGRRTCRQTPSSNCCLGGRLRNR